MSYDYAKWRHHCLCLIVVLALLSNCIVWAIVAALYSNIPLVIWLGCGAAFFTFVAVIQYREAIHYHTRLERSKPTTTA